MSRQTPFPAPKTWQFLVVCFWVAFASAAALKDEIPYIHWYGTLAVIILLWPRLFTAPSRAVKFTSVVGGVLVLSILIIAPANGGAKYQFIEAGKLAAILLIVAPMLLARPDTSRGLRLGAEFATVVNAAVGLAGFLGIGGVLTLMALGRYGTILNPPGSMWRVGILVLVSSSLNLLLARNFVWPLVLFISSIVLLVLDGSRTAAISMFAAVAFVCYVITKEMMGRTSMAPKRLFVRIVILGSIVIAVIASVPRDGSSIADIGFGQRIGTFLSAVLGNGVAGFEEADGGRAEMVRTAISAIINHPFVGTGMGTTAIASEGDPMVVHDAYLQVWADVGLLGFLAYGTLTLGVLLGPWARLKTIDRADFGDRVSFYNGIYVLSCWVISGLFHPLSTELTEWVMFIVGLAGLQVRLRMPAPGQVTLQVMGVRHQPAEMLNQGVDL